MIMINPIMHCAWL